MLDFKQAIGLAKTSAMTDFGLEDITVDEIERDRHQGRDVWSITIGFPAKVPVGSGVAMLGLPRREYRRFLIDATTGELLAMKLRPVE